MMSEIIVLTREQLQEIIREAVLLVSQDLLKLIRENAAKEVMTKNELADCLRCDISKINRLMKEDLPFVKFGEHPRFYRAQIDDWLKNGIKE